MYGATTTPANQFGSRRRAGMGGGQRRHERPSTSASSTKASCRTPTSAANIWTNPSRPPATASTTTATATSTTSHGWDFDGNNNTIYDGTQDDHGTHVAGTIGAVGGNGVGVAGVNWNVTMIPAKFLGRRGGTTANAVKAVDYLTDLKTRHGINIVATNNSWGGGGFSQALLDAINRGGNADILFIAAAGNGGSDGVGDNNDTTRQLSVELHRASSSSGDCVIAVAAITSTGAKSGFSNYGATTVDLGAPGSAIFSTVPGKAGASGLRVVQRHVDGDAARDRRRGAVCRDASRCDGGRRSRRRSCRARSATPSLPAGPSPAAA